MSNKQIQSSAIQKNILLYVLGNGISVIGSSIYTFAIGLYVLNITGSALSFATTLILSIIPIITISPLAGVLVDRFPKKKFVIIADFASGILMLIAWGMTMSRPLSLTIVFVSTFLLSVFATISSIAISSAKPNLVPTESLLTINRADKMINSISSIGGPVIGGIVFSFVDIRLFILINGLSFFAAALFELLLKFDLFPDPLMIDKEPTSLKNEFLEGVNFLIRDKNMMLLFGLFISINFLLSFSVSVPLPYIINTFLGLPATTYGLIDSAFPVGIIIGSLTLKVIQKRINLFSLIWASNTFIAILSSFIGWFAIFAPQLSLVTVTIFYGLILFLIGVSVAHIDLAYITMLQTKTPAHLRGRVLSSVTSLVKVIVPLSYLLSGLLIGKIPITLLPMVGGICSIIAGFAIKVKSRSVLIESAI